MAINGGMNKEGMVDAYNGIQLRHIKEQNKAIGSDVDEPSDCHAE